MSERKKLTPNRSLPELRRILGQTQVQFAAMLGASLPLIKAVECGQRPLSARLAHIIQLATGANLGVTRFRMPKNKSHSNQPAFEPFSDGSVKTSHPEYWWLGSSKPYTRAFYDRVVKERWQEGPQAGIKQLQQLLPTLEKVFIAAAKKGRGRLKNRLPALVISLRDWIGDANRQFKLDLEREG